MTRGIPPALIHALTLGYPGVGEIVDLYGPGGRPPPHSRSGKTGVAKIKRAARKRRNQLRAKREAR